MSGGTGIEAVLFDLGGVLVHFRGISKMGELAGVADPDEVMARWLACPWVRAFEMGQCGQDDFAAGMVAEWHLALTPGLSWRSSVRGPVVRWWVRRIWSARWQPRGTRFAASAIPIPCTGRGAPESKTSCACSTAPSCRFQMGMLKPDLEAFEYVAQSLGLSPQRVLFLDDNQINVDAARTIGFSASRVLGVEQTRIALIDAGVIGQGDTQPGKGDG